jgi:hypothetical protein
MRVNDANRLHALIMRASPAFVNQRLPLVVVRKFRALGGNTIGTAQPLERRFMEIQRLTA